MSAFGGAFGAAFAGAFGGAAAAVAVATRGGRGRSTWRDAVTPKKKSYEAAVPELTYKPVARAPKFYFEEMPWPVSPERRQAERRRRRLNIANRTVSYDKRRRRAAIAALLMDIYGT